VRLNAWLSKPANGNAKDGEEDVTYLALLNQLVFMRHPRRGADAAALLERADAPIPPTVVDVYGMFVQLSAMRDADGMTGFKRMTPSFIADGARLFGWRLAPHEAVAISQLDLAQLFPGDFGFDESTPDASSE
jgi:hypothetical protein